MKVLYTCITGNYDKLIPIKHCEGWTYICFTDNPNIKSDLWKVVYLPPAEKLFRRVKLNPWKYLPEHSVSIWTDGNIEILTDLNEFVKDKDYCLMTHPDRKNIFQEAKACIQYQKDRYSTITEQIKLYRSLGYNEQGLVATGVIVRLNTPKNNMFNLLWLNEVLKYSVRDQLSFNYVAWLCKFEYQTFKFLQGCKYYKHNK